MGAVRDSGSAPVAQKPMANTTNAVARNTSLLKGPVGGIKNIMAEAINTRPTAARVVLPIKILYETRLPNPDKPELGNCKIRNGKQLHQSNL